jgi:hypothetical protein
MTVPGACFSSVTVGDVVFRYEQKRPALGAMDRSGLMPAGMTSPAGRDNDAHS